MARYEMTGFEWRVIEPLLPQNSCGVPRVDDQRVLNGIFWVLRSWGALGRFTQSVWPQHHLLQSFPQMDQGWHLGSDYGRNYRCL